MYRRFVAIIGAIVLGAMALEGLAGFAAARSFWLMSRATYTYEAVLLHHFGLKGRDADLLVAGDSAALQGVVPAEIEARTGLKTINLALFAFSGVEGTELVLDRYLRDNAAPKYVAFYLTPRAALYMTTYPQFERSLAVARYGSAADLLRLLGRDPFALHELAFEYLQRVPARKYDWSGAKSAELRAALERNDGYVRNPSPPLDADCALDSRDPMPSFDYLREMRERYERRGIATALYLAPMVSCDAAIAYYREVYAGVADNGIEVLPGTLFTDYTHPTPDGAIVTSDLFANFLTRRFKLAAR